ncbi:spherulation-specific family 4 protein [Arthrobacter zhangbolii]|uniref:Spherulation-specific family 4 protein n=1 Tax=Arthrobacter zhangbolii TaxID=2886936 RepID=A0A9X1M6F6_9MICC|nr:spherulation-specific family 4 protein [Arthrobacter zhangbolii]MCC3271730.1 spherulation-specific family 4 protein [Arthrobacter zhangbolii]UON93443.1 spherulation-specific family 4 protein [Arthrobacter zhangbolii]
MKAPLTAPPITPPRLAIPWYIHPAAAPQDWAWLAAQEVSFAVLNVHNGPGGDEDPYYPQAVARLRRIRLLGYVTLAYGHRRTAEVIREIRAWQRLYHVDGIMFDEVPSTTGTVRRCRQYAGVARDAGVSLLAANPGVFPSPAHLELFDVTSVFEGTAEAYAGFRHPAWARRVPPARLWHLVHTGAPGQLPALRLAAARHGAGHLFATDRHLPNPWLGPPTAVSDQLAAGHPADR